MGVETKDIPYGTGEVPLLPPGLRRGRLLAWQQIDVVVDVGANAGQYGSAIRAAGYEGRIISFEPLSQAFEVLATTAEADPLWECHRLALGAGSGRARLNVSDDLEASSLLSMEDRHVRHCPSSAYVGTEMVDVEGLDALASSLFLAHDRVYLKLDVQGYELEVLDGSEATLPRVALVEAELSLVPPYATGRSTDQSGGHHRGARHRPHAAGGRRIRARESSRRGDRQARQAPHVVSRSSHHGPCHLVLRHE